MTESDRAYDLWICGDNYLLMDYGQIRSIPAGIKAVSLKNLLIERQVEGVMDLVPSNTSLMIGFDPRVIDADKLRLRVQELMDEVESQENIVVPSRIIELPIYFADPWTRDAIDDYRRNVKPKVFDIDFIIRENGLKDLDEFIQYMTSSMYIVTYMSFGGLPSSVCLDPEYTLSVPKYNPPRTSTPPLAIGMGGSNVSIYPLSSPGGYQLFGILPTPLLQLEQTLPDFKESPVLARVVDRFKFRSIGREEYDAIKAECAEGTYRYAIESSEFDLNAYEASIRSKAAKGASHV